MTNNKLNENIYNIFIDKGLISLIYQKLKQIRIKKKEKRTGKMGKGHEQSRWQTMRKTASIYLKCHTISLIKLKMEMRKRFFSTDQQKKKSQVCLLVLLRSFGKNTGVTWYMCIKKKTVHWELILHRSIKRQVNSSISIGNSWYKRNKWILYNHEKGDMHTCVRTDEKTITPPGKQVTEERVWHACFSVKISL